MTTIKDYKKEIHQVESKSKDTIFKLNRLLNTELTIGGRRFSDKNKESFYNELSILLTSGVDIVEALVIIADQFGQKKLKSSFLKIQTKIVNGDSFTNALRASQMFSDYEIFSLKIGEDSGQVVEILNELSEFYSRKIQQRQRVIRALIYPIIVSITAASAIFFMLRFLVPMFADIYNRFGGELPGITKIVLSISQWLQNYSGFIFLGIFLLVVFTFFIKKQVWYRRLKDFFLFRFPYSGQLFRRVYLARFSRAMSLLLGAGVPVLRSIGYVKEMIGSITFEESLDKVEVDILTGETLYKSFAKFPIYSSKYITMVKVGELTNQLPNMFNRLSEQYTREVEHKTTILNNVLEPLLILGLGVIVGFILIALYLPIFELSTSFGG